jgi:hypothetical protein
MPATAPPGRRTREPSHVLTRCAELMEMPSSSLPGFSSGSGELASGIPNLTVMQAFQTAEPPSNAECVRHGAQGRQPNS